MSTTPLPPCKHEHIQTWRFEDGEVAMWSCVECALKFEPITARADLEAENQRLREALRIAHDHIDMNALRVSHCKDAATITAALESKP